MKHTFRVFSSMLVAATSVSMACSSGGSSSVGVPDGGDAATQEAGDAARKDAGGDAKGDSGHVKDATGAQPIAVAGATALDFGLSDCGGPAPASQAFTIKNTGDKSLTVKASLSGSNAFTLTGASALTVAPGGVGTLTLAAAAVPAASTAGATLKGTLTLTTNDPANASIKIPLTETPNGATLAWASPASGTYDFGQAKVGATATSTGLTLQNTGNADTTVTFAAPTDASFAITPTTGAVPAGGSLAGLSATFTPATTGTPSATSALSATGPICGTSVSSLALKGQGVTGSILVSATTLDFGLSPCGGSAAAAQTITLTNSGSAAFTFNASNVNVGAYTIAPATGSVPANGTATVVVTPAPIPFPSAVPGSYTDTVTVTTDISGDSPHVVMVTQSAQGAIVTASPSTVSFPGVAVDSETTATVSLQNTGNAGANLAFTLDPALTGSPIFGVTPATLTLGAGAPAQNLSLTFAPTDNTPQKGGVLFATDSTAAATVLCQPLPPELTLSGTGLNGGIALDHSSIDFQLVPCGTAGTNQELTVTNNGNEAFTFSATLQDSTGLFALTNGGQPVTNVNVDPGKSVQLTVTAGALPAFPPNGIQAYTANIQLNSNVINAQPINVPITLTPEGAILAWQPSTPLSIGSVTVSQSSSGTASLQNSGNESAAVTFASTGDAEFVAPAGGTAAVGSNSESIEFNAAQPVGTKSTQLSVATTTAICAPLPAPLTVNATSTIGSYTDSGTTFTFGTSQETIAGLGVFGGKGYQFCGTQAPPDTLQICNSGTAAFNLTSVALTTGTYFSASPSGTNVAVGQCVDVTLTASTVPVPLPKDSSNNPLFSFSDTLTVKTDIAGDTPHTYSLSETALGAIVAKVSPTALAFPNTQVNTQSTFDFLVKNTGNAPASLSFPLANAPDPWFTVPSINVGPGQQTAAATFTPTNAQAFSDTATLVDAASTPLCDALPANTQNNGIVLSGTGIPTAATAFSLSPTSWIFGSTPIDDPSVSQGVNCGAAAGASVEPFTVTNGTAVAQSFTAAVTGGYTLNGTASANASGSVGANGQTQITVETPAISATGTPGQAHNGTLTVVIDGNTFTASLTTVTAGAVVNFTTTAGADLMNLNIPYSAPGILTYTDFDVANQGNASVVLLRTITSSLPTGGTFTSDDGSPTATYTAPAAGRVSDDILFTYSGARPNGGFVTESLSTQSGALCNSPHALFVNASN